MKGKNLLVLLVLAAALVGYAVISSKKHEAAPPAVVGKNLLPDIQVNDVEKIVMRSQTTNLVLTKVEDTWIAPQKHNYPANFEKIKKSLLKLADIKIGQVVNAEGRQKAELKMVEPSASTNASVGQAGVVVELIGKGNKKLAGLLIGATRQRKSDHAPMGYGSYPDAQYVSTDGGKSVYLVTELLDELSPMAIAWLDTELLNVSGGDLSEVTMVSTNGETLKLARSKDAGKLAVEGVTDKEEADGPKVSNIESALGYLRFDDVADPALTPERMGLDKPAIFKASTAKGEVYTLKIGAKAPGDAGRYVKLEASYVEPPAPPSTNAASTNAEAKAESKDKPAEKSAESVETEKKIKSLNERMGTWTYVVASYKTDAMTMLRKDVIKKKEEPKKEEAPSEPRPEEQRKEEAKAPVDTKENPIKAETPKAEAVKPLETPQSAEQKESVATTNAAQKAEEKPATKEKKSGGFFRWFKKSEKQESSDTNPL